MFLENTRFHNLLIDMFQVDEPQPESFRETLKLDGTDSNDPGNYSKTCLKRPLVLIHVVFKHRPSSKTGHRLYISKHA